MNLRDLPPHFRKQAEAQLGAPSPEADKYASAQAAAKRAALELQFLHILRCQGGHFPTPVRQHQFAKPRKWAFDFCWPDRMVAIEIDGGVFTRGRHVTGVGYTGDCEKGNEAALRGWMVLHATSAHLDDLSVMRWLERALKK